MKITIINKLRPIMLGWIVTVVLTGCQTMIKRTANDKPNIIIWVADDQYLSSVGCYGANPSYTPNIDQLAKEGMRFTRAYSTSSICTPARSALYTGMYPIKNGAHPNHSGLKEDIPSMPQIMRDLGYRSAIVGKEGVHKVPTRPTNTFTWDAYFPHTKKTIAGAEYNEKASKKHLIMDYDAIEKFMKAADPKPFCMFVASSLPHGPVLSKIENGLEGYPANNWTTDQQFAWFMNTLNDAGKKDKTLVIYVSDNGANTDSSKFTLFEPGVNVPMIISWPGHIQPNSACNEIVDFTDIMPTLMAINGAKPNKQMDGKSLVPLLKGEQIELHQDLFLSYTELGVIGISDPYPIRGVVTKQYKLIHYLNPDFLSPKSGKLGKSPEFLLFDLVNDPGEKNNLFGDLRFTEIQTDLLERLNKWEETVGDQGMQTEYEAIEMFLEKINVNE